MKNITPAGTEVCIKCGGDTGVLATLDVSRRIGYIEGAG